MRSRYAAFALREVDYLWKTLAPEHEDRQHPEAHVLSALRETTRACNFMKLEILDAEEHGDHAEVEFSARVFERGKDRSFRERSEFRRVGGAWRYVGAKSLERALERARE
jgi:SEC-C motif-containing protein